jgi:hypothetical protein
MTIEFATDTEVNARNQITKAIGSAYMSDVKIQGWTLADVTRGNYRNVVSHEEQEKKKRAMRKPARRRNPSSWPMTMSVADRPRNKK